MSIVDFATMVQVQQGSENSFTPVLLEDEQVQDAFRQCALSFAKVLSDLAEAVPEAKRQRVEAVQPVQPALAPQTTLQLGTAGVGHSFPPAVDAMDTNGSQHGVASVASGSSASTVDAANTRAEDLARAREEQVRKANDRAGNLKQEGTEHRGGDRSRSPVSGGQRVV